MNAKLLFSVLALSASLLASADITGLPDLTNDTTNRKSIDGNDNISDKKTYGKGAFNITGDTAATQSDINNDLGANRLGGGGGGNSENPLWVTYEFETNTVVNAYRIWNQGPRGGYSQEARAPKDFYLEGSPDGSEWTMLNSQSNQTGWGVGEPRVFEFRNKTAYKFYRMTFTANVGGADAYIMIQELEYFCRPPLANSLIVTGSPGEYGEPTPGYGEREVEEGDTINASVASPIELDGGALAGCVGWKTETLGENETWVAQSSGEGNAATFVHPGGEVQLTWNFEISNRVETAVHGIGTVTGGGWFLQGESATLKATAGEGYDFVRWVGDTDGVEDPTAAKITVTADSPRTLTAFFVQEGIASVLYVSTAGDDRNDGFSLAEAKATVGAAVKYLDETFMEGTIFVARGTYEQTNEFVLSNAIEVVGLTGHPEDVVFRNTQNNSRVLSLRNQKALVSGVAIENGRRNNDYGGNVLIAGGGGTVSNCVIRSGWGSGVYGANLCVCSPNALVTHCVISNGATKASSDANGIAIYVRDDGAGRISNCLITQNATTNNTFQSVSNNKQLHLIVLYGPAVMDNCTIVDNCHTGLAAVVYAKSDVSSKVYNCVIAKNTTTEGTAASICWGDNKKFVNCVTDGETALNSTCKVGTLEDMFESVTDGKWLPKAGGILDNAGTTSGLTVPSIDLRGNPRIHGDKIDVGCYEVASFGFILRIR